jgi:hypothetical protein
MHSRLSDKFNNKTSILFRFKKNEKSKHNEKDVEFVLSLKNTIIISLSLIILLTTLLTNC